MSLESPGKTLEVLIADAYRRMGARTVKHDVSIGGNQIDIYVEFETSSGLLQRIAVEAKDWSRPAGVQVVNAYATVVGLLHAQRLIDKAIIISQSGFSRPARESAALHGIHLLELADLEAKTSPAISVNTPPAISSRIISFQTLLEAKTRMFVGRDFAFERIDAFLQDGAIPSGYFFIRGDPGVGKSALLAQLVMKRKLRVYHFNSELQGINTRRQFLANICARLIKYFKLSYTEFPDSFDEGSAFLNALLHEASAALPNGDQLVIAVDALDEVRTLDGTSTGNPLFLPPELPENVFFVVTARRDQDLVLPFSNILEWEIESSSDENREDIRAFVALHARSEAIKKYINRERLDQEQFADILADRSEGNYMYLHHVLPAIASGWLAGFNVSDLPYGLRAYYQSHWYQMRDLDLTEFDKLHQPVVCILAAAQEAVPVELIAEWTSLQENGVLQVLKQWLAFLDIDVNATGRKLYRFYHTAFRDFLQEEVDPDLQTYHTLIANSVLERISRA